MAHSPERTATQRASRRRKPSRETTRALLGNGLDKALKRCFFKTHVFPRKGLRPRRDDEGANLLKRERLRQPQGPDATRAAPRPNTRRPGRSNRPADPGAHDRDVAQHAVHRRPYAALPGGLDAYARRAVPRPLYLGPNRLNPAARASRRPLGPIQVHASASDVLHDVPAEESWLWIDASAAPAPAVLGSPCGCVFMWGPEMSICASVGVPPSAGWQRPHSLPHRPLACRRRPSQS